MRRFLALIVAAAIMVTMLPAMSTPVYAASVDTGVTGLSAESSGDAAWTFEDGVITGSVTAESTSGCTGTTYKERTGTLTFTNSSGNDAVLKFDYKVTLSGGSSKIQAKDITGPGSFNELVNAGDTVTVEITSPKGEGTTEIVISNLSLKPAVDVKTLFLPSENGSYTVDGTAITSETTLEKNSAQDYALVATPAAGYKFLGWYSVTNDEYLSFSANTGLKIDEAQTVTAKFVPASAALFDVSGAVFTDLNEAVSYAVNNNKAYIVLLSSGTLPAGDYTIPSGKILLIPFDEANTVYTTAPEVVYGNHANPSAFRTLTMASGASITVDNGGKISVPSKLSAAGTGSGSWNGTPTGKHGRIDMNSGSSITVKDGGGLYVYGYISGSGSVIAKSGSTVYECFQIRCWRGGTATSGMADNSQKVFPLNQYYVQNIEAPLTLENGATERVYTAVNMSNQAFTASATFIGNGGMFKPTGTVTKSYDGTTDRLVLDVDGDFTLSPMSLRITGLPLIGTLDLNTSDFVLPINSNISIHVNSGTTTVSQDVAFFPGSELTVAQGASVELASGKKVYVYDKDQWGAYAAASQQLVPVGYSTVNGTVAKRTAASLTDAVLDINGEFGIKGELYTTESGAAIISSEGTGKVTFVNAAGKDEVTNQATQSGSDMTFVDIPITSAKLLNGDGSYTETAGAAAGTTYYFCKTCAPDGIWESAHSSNEYTLTLEANIPEDSTTELTAEESVKEIKIKKEELEGFTFPADTFSCSGYTLTGWTYDDNGEPVQIPAESVTDAIKDFFTDDHDTLTLKAVWTPVEITVVFDGLEGAVVNDIHCEYGIEIELPTAAQVVREHMQLTGWKNGDTTYEPGAKYKVVGDFEDNKVVMTAQWAPETYTITWMNGEEELDTTVVPYGETPVYEGDTPVKAEDERCSYSFAGWDPEIVPADKDTTYTAVFNETLKTYTITFINEDGSVLQSGDAAYGEMPVYAGETPVKASTDQYEYVFDGWTPEVAQVTGEETYTAKYKENVRSYTVTWLAEDGKTVLDTKTVPYGEAPVYEGETPVKENNDPAQYTYTFAGWTTGDDETPVTVFDPVRGDVTYTAAFTETINEYTITFKNDDGSVLESKKWKYGEIPAYASVADLKKDATAEYTYTFDGWSPEIKAVTGDAEYTAVYKAEKNQYTVTWIIDGAETKESYAYGDMPTHETPSKASTAEYSYAFKEWKPAIQKVTGDAVYTADFTAEKRSYTVIWKNEDGTELHRQQVSYGSVPVYEGSTPEKAADDQYSYTFAGWTPNVAEVTGDVEYTALYTTETNSYEVKWLDYDGRELKAETLAYGEMPQAPEAPEREADAQYSYTFSGWTPEVKKVTGAAVYTAEYQSELRSYTISFVGEDGDVLETQTLTYGSTPAYTGEAPVKAADAKYSYSFAGWDPVPAEVTGDQTYTAVFEETLRSYKVTWKDADGTVLEEDPAVPYGTLPVYDSTEPVKASTDQYDYSFDGWTPEVTEVAGDTVYTAVYKETLKEYTVTWVDDVLDEDGNHIVLEKTEKVPYGEKPVYHGQTPEKAATDQYSYTFDKWVLLEDQTKELTEEDIVTGDVTYLAVYKAAIRTYTVTWKNGETVVAENHANYNEKPVAPAAAPEKEETLTHTYTFTGWADEKGEALTEETLITGDTVFQAVFEEAAKSGWTRWTDDSIYYLEDGVPVTGICRLPYPEDAALGYKEPAWDDAVDGGHPTDGKGTFIFDAEGRLQREANGFYDFKTSDENTQYDTDWLNADSTVWAVNGEILWHPGLVEAEGAFYYFKTGNTMVKDRDYTVTKTNGLSYTDEGRDTAFVKGGRYTFDADGRLIILNGFVDAGDVTYYYVDSVKTYAGLIKVGEDYYYVRSDCTVVKGRSYYVGKTNGLLNAGTYTFDEEGKMVVEPTSGIQKGEDGLLHYYQDGAVQKNLGLIELDGKYYYVNGSGVVVSGKDYAITKTNGLSYTKEDGTVVPFKQQGTYTFGEDGALKWYDGFTMINGKKYYYENGVKTYAGLVLVDGDYYYVRSDCTAVTDQSYYVSKTNGLKEAGKYSFDAEGKMILPAGDVKEGILRDDEGTLRYYVGGNVQKNLGLIVLDGKYYYVNGSGEVINGRDYAITKTNGLKHGDKDFVSGAKYTFDSEGVLCWYDGITEIDGTKYYYENGAKTYAGLIRIDDSYYYVTSACRLVTGSSYYVSKTNGLKDAGKYSFDADGRLVD